MAIKFAQAAKDALALAGDHGDGLREHFSEILN